MSVYVDDMEAPFGNMVMCHMWADSLDELMMMVDVIGVQRKWLQQPPKASWVHFDIAKSKRALAVKAGAIECDRYEPLVHTGRWTKEYADCIRSKDEYHRIKRAMAQERAARWLRKSK